MPREKLFNELRQELIATEGYRTAVYADTLGNPTVGIGHLVRPSDNLELGDVIHVERVEQLFRDDIEPVIAAAEAQCLELGVTSENFLKALVQVNFQLGVNWPTKWPRTFNALKQKDFKTASHNVLSSKWRRQTPTRANNFIKAINDLEKEIKMEQTNVKSGFMTSEFFVANLTTFFMFVLTYVNTKYSLGLDVNDMLIAVIPNLIYILSRAGVKIAAGASVDNIKAIVEKTVNAK